MRFRVDGKMFSEWTYQSSKSVETHFHVNINTRMISFLNVHFLNFLRIWFKPSVEDTSLEINVVAQTRCGGR